MSFDNQPAARQEIVSINQVLAGGLQNQSRLASVTISDIEWKQERIAFGYYQYVITTCLKTQAETITVKRRYTEFIELYKLL